ncbi:TIGR01841 family phasin [uncultured Sphingomonas sp.]|uniref:phasin family protein n=1 Tax=uncultured Sphingomonas sp. TaxID=158754 RepID=UPI0025CC9712|nr:TIGR01841 family phasin [uncultured Sphingomonas sp.]
MASKGPKTTAKPAAKTAARGAPKPAILADAAAVTPPPVPPLAETIVPAAALVPAPVETAAPQEVKTHVEETIAAPAETAKAVAEPVIEAAETVAPAVTTSTAKEISIMATTYENATTQAHTAFADMNERAKAAVEKSTKLVEEANEFAKGNIEALVESGRIAAKGFETLGQEAADYSRRSFESATAAMKNLASVKSPTDFFKLQSDYMRSAFDSYVAEASKHTEAMIKLAGDAAQPISNRFAVAVEKVKTTA